MSQDFLQLYKHSIERREEFWARVAEELYWEKRWDKTLDASNPPFYRWFLGGLTNIAYNILEKAHGEKTALIWVSSDMKMKAYTYTELKQEVDRWACALREMGVRAGDRVVIYMPMIPQTAFAVLAVAKIGAVHSVVFSGFSTKALADRIADSGAKLVLTVDAMRRRGKEIALAPIATEAAGGRAKVAVFNYLGERTGGDYAVEDYLKSCNVSYHWANADDPLFILYTSGTTGRPKGLYHGHGSYMVWAYAHTKWLFGFGEGDSLFSTADIGWINGHTYGLYGPLLNKSTVVWYEDAPDYPHPGVWWEVVDMTKSTFIWLAPTAIRLLMRYGDDIPHKYSLDSLKLVVSAGEILGIEAWRWLRDHICKRRPTCHVIETWGQTENSGFIAAPGGLGVGGIKYKEGSVGLPYPGIEIKILDDEGKEVGLGVKGHVVVVPPTPPAFALGVWGDPARWVETYWTRFKGYYYTGDLGYKDEDGYVYILGRSDDVIKVAGHRLSPAEVENVAMSHPLVVEAAAVAIPDELRGSVLAIFVVPRSGASLRPEEVAEFIKKEFGPIAVVSRVFVVNKLPKTRTGKIMRRLLRAVASGQPLGDLSTLEDEASVEEVRKALEELRSS